MRLFLKRQPGTPARKPLRERAADLATRLAETRERAGRTLAVARILMKPEAPKAAPVDRAALVNYITFLSLERAKCAAELYPHMTWHARRFTLSMNAAWRFFHDGNNSLHDRESLAPASTRALRVLDLVGIDWREDVEAGRHSFFDDGGRADTGERPTEPKGTPAADAVAVEAFDNLIRLDRALDALGGGDRDTDDVPGYDALDTARGEALSVLERVSPETLIGLRAKARAILCDSLKGDFETVENLGRSLARDLLGAHHSVLEPHPDPIFAAIAECRQQFDRMEAAFASFRPGETTTVTAEQRAGGDAFNAQIRAVLTATPRTAEGCKALASFIADDPAAISVCNTDDWRDALRSIARSPLL